MGWHRRRRCCCRRRHFQGPHAHTAAQLPASLTLSPSLQLFLMSLHKLLDHTPARAQGMLPPRLLGGAEAGGGGADEGRAAGGEVEETQVRSKIWTIVPRRFAQRSVRVLTTGLASASSCAGILPKQNCVSSSPDQLAHFRLQLPRRLLAWEAAIRSMWPLRRQRLKSRHRRWGAPCRQQRSHDASSLQLAAVQACACV